MFRELDLVFVALTNSFATSQTPFNEIVTTFAVVNDDVRQLDMKRQMRAPRCTLIGISGH